MSMITQRRMMRLALALGGLLTLALVSLMALSLSPLGSARADTPPRLEVDLGMPMRPSQDGIAPVRRAQTDAPTPGEAQGARPAPASGDEAMTLKRVLQVEGPFRHGDYVWDEEGVPPGKVVITVDLQAQTIALFREGYQIGAAVIIHGADDKPTPVGAYRISQKKVHHISNLYNAPMPYMMRLTDDGVAIHASEVAWGNATHGCIGVPLAFAKLIFAQAQLGTEVIVTSGKMMAVPEGAQLSQANLRS